MARGSVRFGGEFEFDATSYQLLRSGRPLKVERIPLELLLLLVEQPGQLVTREQIVERIWGPGVALDTDNSINGAIRKLRQVLKDDPDQPRFIQTVTGRGYRFIALLDATEPEAGATPPPAGVSAGRALAVSARRVGLMLLGLVAVVAMAVAYSRWTRPRPAPRADSGRLMLAVLPLENLTGNPAEDYFSDGLTEEMITQLGNLDPQRLGVIARTSVMSYKHTPQPVKQLGRDLGVQYVLEGSVRRDANKVRVTVQLIQVSDRTHLWAQRYDRDLSNLLKLQGEIAQAVADEIKVTLTRGKRLDASRPSPLSPTAYEAYDLYLKGRYFWNKRTPEDLQQAIGYFQQAVEKDPSYSRAYAGLAEAYALMGGYSLAPQEQFIPKARAAALTALEMDETLPEAHTSLAVIAQTYDWDWPTAEKEYRRAIELEPNDATAHHWYAECLALQGRFNEAFPEIERARQLDPLSLIITTDYAAILYFSRQYDRAIPLFRSVLDMEPDFPRARLLAYAYVQQGKPAEALAYIAKWQRLEDDAWNQSILVYVYGRSGQPAQARRALEKLEQLSRRGQLDAAPLVVAYVGLGRKEDALAWLQKAQLQHSPALTALKVDPIYDPLRDDPRFQEVLRGVGFTP